MSIPESRVSRDSPFENLRANGKPKGSCFYERVLSEPEALPPGQKPLAPSWRTFRAGSWGGA